MTAHMAGVHHRTRPGHRRTLAIEGRCGERLLAGYLETGRPAELDEHLARYGATRRLGQDGSRRLIEAVGGAGLTGRGGAGFPTAAKLRAVAGAARPGRIVVANGMESEPASAKDKALLRLAPHLVLDGIVLAAQAVDADEAHLCVAPSREGLDEKLRELIDKRQRQGLDAIEVRVHTPPHHYVSSEASALTSWLGGGQAKPTTTPPRTAERGVNGRPTLVDNVETLAHLALIARFGPAWFRSRGTVADAGTALVTLTGAVAASGVYEIEYGLPLTDVFALARPARDIQAVLVGGYFGTWVPAHRVRGLAYDSPGLAAVGANPGASVLAVLPGSSCGLAETSRILTYLAGQSARQCGPCRFGLPAVAEDFAHLAFSPSGRVDFERLTRRVTLLTGRGACKHPDGAAHLAASAMRVFAAEMQRHAQAGPCPAASHAPPLLPTPLLPIGDGDWR